MQAPAIFLIAATLLFVGMWSSDSAYRQQETKQAAIDTDQEFRNRSQEKTPVIAQLPMAACIRKTQRESVAATTFIEASIDEYQQPNHNELSIPVFSEEDKLFSGLSAESCRWMERANEQDDDDKVPSIFEGDHPSNGIIQQRLAKKMSTIGHSLLQFSNNMVNALIEMHQHQKETRLSTASQKTQTR